jgi:FkbM family methyltransferase
MEGDECYNFSRIKTNAESERIEPICTILDIGANVGGMTRQMCQLFPDAVVHAFEPTPEYFEKCVHNTRDLRDRVVVYPVAVTARHMYEDDFGQCPNPATMVILQALPSFGPGWEGSHRIVPEGTAFDSRTHFLAGVAERMVTLDEIVARILEQGIETIDLVKSDAEGSENSFLGCASAETLSRCRYIVGEWHDLARFSAVIEHRLIETHNINVAVDPYNAGLGSFFAELKSEPCILESRPIEQVISGQSYCSAPFRSH